MNGVYTHYRCPSCKIASPCANFSRPSPGDPLWPSYRCPCCKKWFDLRDLKPVELVEAPQENVDRLVEAVLSNIHNPYAESGDITPGERQHIEEDTRAFLNRWSRYFQTNP